MKRTLLWTLGILVFVVLGSLCTVLVRADRSGLPAPDPSTPIHLPDGSTRPLAEVLQLVRDGVALPEAPEPRVTIVDSPDPAEKLSPEQHAERNQVVKDAVRDAFRELREEQGPIFSLAESARDAGRLDEAAALYLSVPANDPRYARAQRRLAWEVLTKGLDQPRRAVPFADAAVCADPFSTSAWRDLTRVYGATLGIDTDDGD